MKKFVVRFFLSLSVLLLGTYGLLYVNAYSDSIHTPSIKPVERSEDAADHAGLNNLVWIKRASTDGPRRVFKIDQAKEVREEEEEGGEWDSFKRNHAASKYFTAVLSAQIHNYSAGHLNEILPFCKDLSHILYRRHLILQVFRI